MSAGMETQMFGPHDVDAGHDHAIDLTAAVLDLAIERGSIVGAPVYYTVLGLLRAAARLGVIGLGPVADGMEPMLKLMLKQEAENIASGGAPLQ